LYLLESLAPAVLRLRSAPDEFFDKEKKQKKKESNRRGGVAKKPKGNGISPEG
jgi:hypothetical protein